VEKSVEVIPRKIVVEKPKVFPAKKVIAKAVVAYALSHDALINRRPDLCYLGALP
jgi:hypothetical protein